MNIKKGDKVEVLTGRDGGKTGRVLSVDPRNERVTVEKLNFVKRHRRPRKEGEKGEIVNVERPLPASRVMVVCSACGKASRSGSRIEQEKKVRYCKRCNATW